MLKQVINQSEFVFHSPSWVVQVANQSINQNSWYLLLRFLLRGALDTVQSEEISLWWRANDWFRDKAFVADHLIDRSVTGGYYCRSLSEDSPSQIPLHRDENYGAVLRSRGCHQDLDLWCHPGFFLCPACVCSRNFVFFLFSSLYFSLFYSLLSSIKAVLTFILITLFSVTRNLCTIYYAQSS